MTDDFIQKTISEGEEIAKSLGFADLDSCYEYFVKQNQEGET